MKSTFLSLSATVLMTVFSETAAAQDPHAGHNHQAPGHNHVEAPLPAIDHVLTESPEDHVMGANSAPITMIAYASVMCPHCAQWFTTEWPVFKENHIDTGQVRFVFREFPTSPVNYARTGFVIANCAPRERYFEHIVYQMQNQNYIFSAIQANQARPMYQSLAYQAGLETPQQMQACFDEPDSYQRMDKAILRARHAGIQSVPAFIIDGQVFKGDLSALGLGEAINTRLSQAVTRMPTQRPAPAQAQRWGQTPVTGQTSRPVQSPIPQRVPAALPQQTPVQAPRQTQAPVQTQIPAQTSVAATVPPPVSAEVPLPAPTPTAVETPEPKPEPKPESSTQTSASVPVPSKKPSKQSVPSLRLEGGPPQPKAEEK